MEHDLVLVYPGVEALLARHVGPDVQSPAVASPVLECDSVTQQGEELQEPLTAGLVAMKVLSMMVSSLYQRTEGGGSPPVATHWMVRGSPSLKGPTATESDSCLPRSPRMRGREGGTDKIYIKHICKGELNNKRGAVKNDKQVFFATSLKVYLLNSACYRSCALGMKNNVAFVFLPICL